MSAAAVSVRPTARRDRGLSLPGRLLRLELRHGAMLSLLDALGIAMCFPAVVKAATASMPPADPGASTSNALNAVRGVFGIAAVAAVFAAVGSYTSAASPIIHRFKPAEWVLATLVGFGRVAAALAPPKSPVREEAER